MQKANYIDSMLAITSATRVCFSWGGREYTASIALDDAFRMRLRELETDPLRYGARLFDAVFSAGSRPHIGFQTALTLARAQQQRLRFRLNITTDDPDLHALFWELLYDTSQRLPIGCSPDTVLSRYAEISAEPGTPVARKPRLLCMIAAPRDHQRYGLSAIDYELVKKGFEDALEPNRHVLEFELIEPPATLLSLRTRLHENEYHILHILGHGVADPETGACLVLERADGSADFVHEEQLRKTFLGDRDLRLVTLVACHGNAAASKDTFGGLAGRLVDHGLPAVVAFRSEVKHSTARFFTEHFYRELARTGCVDVALSEARQRLYLDKPDGLGWTSPVLSMRLADGMLWVPASAPAPESAREESSGQTSSFSRNASRSVVLVIAVLTSIATYRELKPVETARQEPTLLPISPIITPTSPPSEPSPPPPAIDVTTLDIARWQQRPFIEAVFLYTKLPDAPSVDTTTWRSKLEGVVSRELDSIGVALTQTSNARWLALVDLKAPAISEGELGGQAAKTCQITASFQVYRERELVDDKKLFRERAIKFDAASACETAVQRVAIRVGTGIVGAHSQ